MRQKEQYLRRFLYRLMLLAVMCMPNASYAANGCEDDSNDVIVPELALCSTHAFNIGDTTNPDGSDRELMQDVIAMKTTLITQQLYQQYAQMESMLRRLKTQLEKAVLTTGMQAAGAKATTEDSSSAGGGSGGSSSYSSTNRNIKVEGARDCNMEMTDAKVLECLQSNLSIIYEISGNGSNASPEARKQLANDFVVLKSVSGSAITYGQDASETTCSENDGRSMNNRKKFEACLDAFRSGLRATNGALQEKERQNNWNPWQAMSGQASQ